MPKDNFKLPSGETVPRIFGATHPGRGTAFLNAVRMGPAAEIAAQELAAVYRAMEKTFARELAIEVERGAPNFDAIVSPPSSRCDALAFKDAIMRGKQAYDFTANFNRHGKFKIGDDETTRQQAFDELIYTPSGNEGAINSLLIVDESTATGKTVEAVLQHLRDAGLPDDCKVTVATWARI
jgi:predicted amidophosphoribosyltransferase